tara:strand:+ start:1830 stop:2333 length:504 start_codon:yes stop_codon:yes gene_type:complete
MRYYVLENFFDNFDRMKEEFKEIPFYDLKKFNKIEDEKQQWPGKRSLALHKKHPILFNLLIKELPIKFSDFFGNKYFKCDAYIHLRNKKDGKKDWVHKDDLYQYTLMVYLSETNLDSGTAFYDEDFKETGKVAMVQNRALIFDGRYNHAAYGHHDGRLTLNGFIIFT